jgi:transposase-like protein
LGHYLEVDMARRRHRRYSVEFKLQLIRAYLVGEGSLKGIAARYELNHSVLTYWLRKYQQGELTDDDHLADQVHEWNSLNFVDTEFRPLT